MERLFTILGLCLLFFACESNQEYSTSKEMATHVEVPNQVDDSFIDNRKIIRNGKLELQVAQVEKTTEEVNKICQEIGAFISDLKMENSEYIISNKITIRVKREYFDVLMLRLRNITAITKNYEVISKDVTEEYIDVASRLHTKKEVRARYVSILREKTTKMKDVLQAEEAIRKITEEIEAKEGKIRYLNDRLSYCTIRVVLHQKMEKIDETLLVSNSFWSKSIDALSNGWSFVTSSLLFFMNIWPICVGAIVIAWKRTWVKKQFASK